MSTLRKLLLASGDTVRNNTFLNGTPFGLYLNAASNITVYHNNFIRNTTQVSVIGSFSNSFNQPAPVGGNFWSDWTTPDANADGFVDNPYTVSTPSDVLPWTTKNDWAGIVDTQAPVTTESHSGTPGNSDWYLSDVSVSLTAVDNSGGSGVKGTEYSLNSDQNWLPYDPPLSITGLSALSFNNDLGTCSRAAAGVILEVSVVDDLSGLTGYSNTAPGTFPKGTTAVTWTATDKAGNVATRTQSITINDVEPPVIFTPGRYHNGHK